MMHRSLVIFPILLAAIFFSDLRTARSATTCTPTSLSASGSCRWNYLIQRRSGQGTSIKMSDYFPSLADHPTTFLRKIYYRQNGTAYYMMQVIDPLPLQGPPGYMIEPGGILQTGAHYYNIVDILPLGNNNWAYNDTWHMRNSPDGSVASITDSFAAHPAQLVLVNGVATLDSKGTPISTSTPVGGAVCQWPTTNGCEGSTHFYWGSQQNDKLVYGGPEIVGTYSGSTSDISDPSRYPVYMPEWLMESTPANYYGTPYYYMSNLQPGSPGQTWGESHYAVNWVLESYPTYTVPVTGKTYSNVIKVLFMHGAMMNGKPYIPNPANPANATVITDCPPPADLKGFTWPPTYSSFIQIQWLAKGVGYIQLEDVYDQLQGSEEIDPATKKPKLVNGKPVCHTGSYTDGAGPWSGYLGYAGLEDRNSHNPVPPGNVPPGNYKGN